MNTVIELQNPLIMRIQTKNQYNTVLKEIDVLLELSFLDKLQTKKLKSLLDALDEYQTYLYEAREDATASLASDFMEERSFKFN